MNSTTVSVASGALPAMGVSPRSDARKTAAVAQPGQGDFQRMLKQAEEKKAAAQQQARQLETRQTDQRLQERKLQQRQLQDHKLQDQKLQGQKLQGQKLQDQKLQEQRQANTYPLRGDKASVPAPANQSQAQPVAKPGSADVDEGNTAMSRVAEPAPNSPATVDVNFELPQLWPEGGMGEVVEGEVAEGEVAEGASDLNLAVPAWVSLEQLAQAVAELSGAAALPGRERAGGMAGTGMAGGFRPSLGEFYSNQPTPSGQPATASGNAGGALVNGALVDGALVDGVNGNGAAAAAELGFSALSRQLRSATGAQLSELSQDSGTPHDPAPGSSVISPGQTPEGRPAPLTAGAASLNMTAGLRAGVGQPEWHNAIAERVAVMASKNLTSAEIQLDPPELGQLLVRVTLNHEHASVTFASQHAGVREALDQTAHRLREMFDAEGLNLVNVDVSDRSFQQRQQQDAGALPGGPAGDEEDAVAQPVLVRQGQGLIDHFV